MLNTMCLTLLFIHLRVSKNLQLYSLEYTCETGMYLTVQENEQVICNGKHLR